MILSLAQYERSCAQKARKALVDDLQRTEADRTALVNAIDLFVGTTELYSDIYVTRDIANRVR